MHFQLKKTITHFTVLSALLPLPVLAAGGKMDPALNAKFRQVAEQRAANMAPLRSALPGNLFKAYCTRATCNDAVNTAIAAFGNG